MIRISFYLKKKFLFLSFFLVFLFSECAKENTVPPLEESGGLTTTTSTENNNSNNNPDTSTSSETNVDTTPSEEQTSTSVSVTVSVGGDAFPIDTPVILAYFPSWSENWVSAGQSSKLRDIPAFVNHLFLGFGKPNLRYEKGSYDLSATGIEVPYDGCTLKESVSALRDKGINVILSVGGETFWKDESSYDIDYQQIKDLVDDIGFAGIDWDFEPDGSFQQIGSSLNINRFIAFFEESRKLMPREQGYLLACAPAGVGALGGQLNDDPESPYRFEQRNVLTGETDALLYQGTQSTNGINLFGFGSTGHMIPVLKAVGDEIDLIAFQGYNTGASTNRKIMYDANAYYADQYGFVIAAGVHYPPEPWGPFYEYTHENVADLSQHIYSHPNRGERNDGIMIWQLLLEGTESSAYSYLNVASKALNGTSESESILLANDFEFEPYKGGSEGCGSGSGGSVSLCERTVYFADNQYPNPGTEVVFNCQIWKNKWYINPNEQPGENEGWEKIGDCSEGEGCG